MKTEVFHLDFFLTVHFPTRLDDHERPPSDLKEDASISERSQQGIVRQNIILLFMVCKRLRSYELPRNNGNRLLPKIVRGSRWFVYESMGVCFSVCFQLLQKSPKMFHVKK